jgi:hypothetical protein
LHAKQSLVSLAIEPAVALEGRLGEDLHANLLVRHPHADTVGHVQQQRLPNHVVKDLGTQASLLEERRVVGRAETLAQLDACLLSAPTQVTIGDLDAVDRRDDRLPADTQIGLNAPQGEWNTDESDDDPGEPALGTFPNGLKHEAVNC